MPDDFPEVRTQVLRVFGEVAPTKCHVEVPVNFLAIAPDEAQRATIGAYNQLPMQLFERQQHLERLRQCLEQARAGSGKVVLVAGEAGIGKSSLI